MILHNCLADWRRDSHFFLALALALEFNFVFAQETDLHFDHEKITVCQKNIEFVAFTVKSLPRLQSPFRREKAAEYGRPELFGDLEQEQEKTLTPIG